MDIFEKTIKLMNKTTTKNLDLTHELQTEIDPNILFRRNTVNVLIGKKGSGKTYNVFREIIKLRFIPKEKHRYTKMIYVRKTDYDPTFERLKDLIPLPVEIISFDEVVPRIKELCQAKAVIQEIKDKTIDIGDIEPESIATMEDILGSKVDGKHDVFHTIILLDDCAYLFNQRNKKNSELFDLLFVNRQPKITYFLTMQDPKGFDTSLKEAVDTWWIFGQYSKHKIDYALRFIPHEIPSENIWLEYAILNKSQALVFSVKEDGTEMGVLSN